MRAGGSDSGQDMIIQEDTIFVSGMSPQTTEDDITNHFGAIGVIKVSFICKKKVCKQIDFLIKTSF